MFLIPFFLRTHTERLEVFANHGKGYEWVFLLQRVFVLTSGVVYTVISLWLLRVHVRNVHSRFSYTEKVNLLWLRYMIYGAAVVWITVFSGNDFLIFSLVALFVLLLGYFGIKQVGIFTQTDSGDAINLADSSTIIDLRGSPTSQDQIKVRYLKSTLSPEKRTEIHDNLTKVMKEQKLFLNPELSIGQLAQAISVHPNHLSQVINLVEAKTFYDFINGWRINEFKIMAAQPENRKYTLLALAFECGFNSKTAFYRNFKNVTGQSPTQYLKDQHIQIQAG